MKQYKVIAKNVVFRLKGKEYILKAGDTVELPDHITTTALVERKRIEEVAEQKEPKAPKPPKTPKPENE